MIDALFDVLLLAGSPGAGQDTQDGTLVEGGLYSTLNADGTFCLVKVLKIEHGGTHLLMYAERFVNPPESTLYATRLTSLAENSGSKYRALSREKTASLRLSFVRQWAVFESDLDRCRRWAESEGGFEE